MRSLPEELVIYTCIMGDYDWLLPPVFTSDDIRYICFTDRPDVEMPGWEVRPVDPSLANHPPNLVNRRYKFFPWDYLPPHQWSLYVDGNIRILSDPRPLIGGAEQHGIHLLAPPHWKRTNVRQELESCLKWGRIPGSAALMAEERLDFYDADGFQNSDGLTENNVLFRAGDPSAIRPAMEMWWSELKYFAGRDQLSLPYVIWKSGLTVRVLPITSRAPNRYFRAIAHKKGAATFVGYLRARRFDNFGWKLAHLAVPRRRNQSRRFRRGGTPPLKP